jgi:hypothetical protein
MTSTSIIKSTMEPKDFPLLVQSKTSGKIILFFTDTTGTVVNLGDRVTSSEIGQVSNNLTSCFNADIWTILPSGSSVTLVQE